MTQTLAALNMNNVLMGLFIVAFLVICIVLMLAVLIQKPQGGGLAGAFGSGAGSGQTAFGAKTGDALTWFTIAMFVLWLGAAIGLNLAFQPGEADPTTVMTPEGVQDGAGAETGTPATEGGDAPATGGGAPVPIQPVPVEPPVPAPTGGEQPATPPATEPAPEPAPQPEPEQQPATPPAPGG